MRRTVFSISRRAPTLSNAIRAPVPAALPADSTRSRLQSGIAKHHRVLSIDVTAEGAGQSHAIDRFYASVVHEQLDAGIQSGLGS